MSSVLGVAFLVTRACFERIGGLEESFFAYYEEVDYCLRARAAGFRVVVAPASTVRHDGFRGFAGGFTPLAAYLKARNLPLLVRRHGGPLAWLAFLPTYAAMLAASAAVYALRGEARAVVPAIGRGVADAARARSGPPPELAHARGCGRLMRIAIGAIVRTLGGPATYAIELVRALAERRTPGLEYVVLTDGPEAFDGMPVAVEHVPLRTPWAQPLWDHVQVPRALRRVGADLYHGTKNAVPLAAPCPSVVTIHDLAVYHHPESFAAAQRWHLRAHTPHAVARRASDPHGLGALRRRTSVRVFRAPPTRCRRCRTASATAFGRSPTRRRSPRFANATGSGPDRWSRISGRSSRGRTSSCSRPRSVGSRRRCRTPSWCWPDASVPAIARACRASACA